MKTKLTETKFKCAIGVAGQLLSRAACLGAVTLICSTAFAQNLFVSGSDARGGGKFIPDGGQSNFTTELTRPIPTPRPRPTPFPRP